MSEYTLEELHKRCLPALRRAELTELAGNEELSPSKVFEIAAESYPNRVAKAARFLAIVRRDYGTGAFEALVNIGTLEPAPQKEHVQENTMQNTHAVLSWIQNPKTRLEIMTNFDLQDELSQEITRLSEAKWQFYFEDGIENASIGRAEVLAYASDVDNPLYPFVLVLRDPETFGEVNFDAHRSHPAIRIHLPGLFKVLQWDEQQINRFASIVLFQTSSHEVHGDRNPVLTGTLRVAKHFRDFESPLFRQVELWFIRAKFATGRVFEMRDMWLNTRYPDFRNPEPKAELPTERELYATVNRMRELGMSYEQIRQDFLRVINGAKDNCRPEFMLALMGASCFHEPQMTGSPFVSFVDPDRESILLNGYLDHVWKEYVKSGSNGPDLEWLGYYCRFFQFLRCSINTSSWPVAQQLRAVYEEEFVGWLSEGHLTTVTEALAQYGVSLGLLLKPEYQIPELLLRAFALAIQDGRCGVAVALYDKYGDRCFGTRPESSEVVKRQRSNSITELRQYAKALGQKTKLS